MRLLALLLAAVAFVPAAGAGGAGFLTLNQLSNHADPSLLLRWRGCVAASELPEEPATALTPTPTLDLTDDASWEAGPLPEPRPLRPLPVGAVLKRLGPSGLKLRGEDLAAVLERAYASFAASAE